MGTPFTLRVDGGEHPLTVDTRTTLLDALRERLRHTSPKRGCYRHATGLRVRDLPIAPDKYFRQDRPPT